MRLPLTTVLLLSAVCLQACGYVGLDLAETHELSEGGSTGGGDGANASGGAVDDAGSGGDGSFGGALGSGGNDGSGGILGTGGEIGTGGSGENSCWPFCEAANATLITSYTFDLVMEHFAYLTLGAQARKSTDVVHHGERSQYFQQGAAGSEAELSISFPAITENWFYLRAWIFVGAQSVSGDLGILELKSPMTTAISLSLSPEGTTRLRLTDAQVTADSAPLSYPEGEWFCLQVGAHVSDAMGSVSVRINEKTAVEVLAKDTMPVGGIGQIAYGITATSAGQLNGKVYFDELVLDDEPVPCDLYAPNQ